MKQTCNRCLSTFEIKDTTVTVSQFCDFCCQDGVLLYQNDDVHAFRQRLFDKLHAEGTNEFVARFQMLLIGHAPYWQKRRY